MVTGASVVVTGVSVVELVVGGCVVAVGIKKTLPDYGNVQLSNPKANERVSLTAAVEGVNSEVEVPRKTIGSVPMYPSHIYDHSE